VFLLEKKSEAGKGFDELIEIVARLRGEGGCPWDREQTHQSLKSFLLEETYELLEAIERGEAGEMEEELGDLLQQVVFHCQIASEGGRFDTEKVLSRLKEKLVRRHPHVFADKVFADSAAVLRHWVKTKAGESKGGKSDRRRSSLGEVPRTMPALARAQKLTERASYFGFDWSEAEPVWRKVEEEWNELKEASKSGSRERISEEMGDLFFSLVNLSRHLDLQAEEALAQSIDRFLERFQYIEDKLREKGKGLEESSLEEMNALWDEAKKAEPGRKKR
jgi:tetrapyrrole methylase family protein/MazG family protein